MRSLSINVSINQQAGQMYLLQAAAAGTQEQHTRKALSISGRNTFHTMEHKLGFNSISLFISILTEPQQLRSLSVPFHYLSLWLHHKCAECLCGPLHFEVCSFSRLKAKNTEQQSTHWSFHLTLSIFAVLWKDRKSLQLFYKGFKHKMIYWCTPTPLIIAI